MAARKKRVVEGASFSLEAPATIASNTIYRRCVFKGESWRSPVVPNMVGDTPPRPVTDVAFEECSFFDSMFLRFALADSAFRACSFRGVAGLADAKMTLFDDGSVERVTFDACTFEKMRLYFRGRGVKFVGCTFTAPVSLDTSDMAGVMLDGLRMSKTLFAQCAPLNYSQRADGRVVAARGITEAGEIATYRVGNEFLKRFILTKQWSSGDRGVIDGLVFDGLDLSGLDFERVAFKGCGFHRCDLSDGQRLNTTACRFGKCTMRRIAQARFIEAHLDECDLMGSSMHGGGFFSATVARSNFRDVRMPEADLRHSTFDRCDFTDAKLRDAVLVGTRGDLDGAVLDGAHALETDRAFLRTVTAPMGNGKPWDGRLPRPTWELEPSAAGTGLRVVRAWSRT